MFIVDVTAYIFALTPARVALWPMLGGAGGVTLATAVRDSRRRSVLNEHLHELRRPLQALALMAPPQAGRTTHEVRDGTVELAAAALAALEREINGGRTEAKPTIVALRPLVEAARRRWRPQAEMAGAALAVREDAAEALVEGDRIELAAALDNLIANAIEHGGDRIELAVDQLEDRICLAVVDSGSGAARRMRGREAGMRGRDPRKRRDPRGRLGRLSGRAHRGHGLRLVRRTVERHGGTFALHRGEAGTSAVLELPPAAAVGER